MRNKAIIFFDLDGTLIDSRKDLALSVNLARKELSLPPLQEEKIVSFVGNGLKKLAERAFAGENISVDIAFEKIRKIYSEHLLDFTRLYPQTEDALIKIKSANFATVVISNKLKNESVAILDGLGVSKYFDLIIGDGEGIPLKPAPDAIFKAAQILKITLTDSSWIIGDNWTDLLCGKNAGIKCAYAKYGFGDPKNESYHYCTDSIANFAEFLLSSKIGKSQ